MENADDPCAQPVDEGVDKRVCFFAVAPVTCDDVYQDVWRQNTFGQFFVHGRLFIHLSTNPVTLPQFTLPSRQEGPDAPLE